MKKTFSKSGLVQQALTTPGYASSKRGVGNNSAFVPYGATMLHDLLKLYVKEDLKIENYWQLYVNEAFSNENLAIVFDTLSKMYEGLAIKISPKIRNDGSFPSHKMKSQAVRALFFATSFDNSELYYDILNEAKKRISLEDTAYIKFCKMIDKDTNGQKDRGFLSSLFTKQVDKTKSPPVYN